MPGRGTYGEQTMHDFATRNGGRRRIGIKPTTILLAVAMLPALSHAQTVNICDRTPLVREEILRHLGVTERFASACESASAVEMRRIITVSLRHGWLGERTKVTELKAGDFADLPSLYSLDLGDNELAALPADLFDGLTSLQSLSLGNNRLTALPADLFDGLTSLRSVDLGLNRLATLPADLFDGRTSLQTLYLHNNRFTTLPEDLFDGLTNLRWLELGSNKLCSLPTGIFDGLTSLQHLSLPGNHLFEYHGLTNDELKNLPLFDGLPDLTQSLTWYVREQTEPPEGTCASDGNDGDNDDGDNGGDNDGDNGDDGDGDNGDNGGRATAPTHTHPYAPIGHAHDTADFHTHVEAYDVRYASRRHHHDADYPALSHTHPKRTAARLRLACGERCEAMASQPDIADLIEDTFWLEQAQCSTPRTRDIGAASCQNSSVGRRGLTYCGGGEGNLNSLMTNPPSGIGGKEITISEGVKASVAETLALQIAELGLTCEEAAMVLYRGQFHLDSCRAQADYGRMAQAIAKATGWDSEGVTLPTLATITRNRKCGDALSATQ